MDNNEDNPLSSLGLTVEDAKASLHKILAYLPTYFRNPLEAIKKVPEWDWLTIILLSGIISALSSTLYGIVGGKILNIFLGFIIGPVMGLVLSFILSGVIFYACEFILRSPVHFKTIFTIFVLANVPAQILNILTPLSGLITFVCILTTAGLLIIGLVENLKLDRKKTVKIVGSLTLIVSFFWLLAFIRDFTSSGSVKIQHYTPQSLEQIRKELNE